jgi:hypothetical protein
MLTVAQARDEHAFEILLRLGRLKCSNKDAFTVLAAPQTSKHQLANIFSFICADAAHQKDKKSAAARWCFKVCSPYSARECSVINKWQICTPDFFYYS